MKKTCIENFIESIPTILKSTSEWLKGYISEHSQEILNNSSGTVALALKLIVNPLIEKYQKEQTIIKLQNLGAETYLNAAYNQALESLSFISDGINTDKSIEELIEYYSNTTCSIDKTCKNGDILVLFQPEYHPLIVYVKNSYIELLDYLKTNSEIKKKFINHFNKNIAERVISEFGNDYTSHCEEIKEFWLEKNESILLWDMYHLNKIGFEKDECLKYETTFGYWREIYRIKNIDDINSIEDENENYEDSLLPINEMISQYFECDPDNHLNHFMFIIADFGKGKSVFLKQYASELAKRYIEEHEGYFPIYFNLRHYKEYSPDDKLGVINDFLKTKYCINISTDYFKSKKYFFLIDSLDESGELNYSSIKQVIESIKQIQNIDKTIYRTNKIIITSRPFSDGLESLIKDFNPYLRTVDSKQVQCYASLYGFTKVQFNDWLLYSLKNTQKKKISSSVPFVERIFTAIEKNKEVDIYSILIKDGTLTASELRRPIFAYMIFQLILNNIDILKIGKIGVYLSFLNLLTKEAKHVKDPNYTVKLNEEFEFRNILHSTAALWMYERHKGKQGSLNKADLCRVLDGSDGGLDDSQMLSKHENETVTQIQFLSHSYFGENDNTLHFQHQSFAEILLAEYYLKVIICYSLDSGSKVDEARARLILGKPTDQTMLFLIDLLHLLAESAQESLTQNTLEKRKLLFPLIASLSMEKNNNLCCKTLALTWYDKIEFNNPGAELPKIALNEWPIKSRQIDKILEFCKKILNSSNNFILTKADVKSSLYDNELLLIKNNKLSNIFSDIDRWIALLIGNTLYNNINDLNNIKLFNWDYNINYENLFDMITSKAYSNSIETFEGAPWRTSLFNGINMKENELYLPISTSLNLFDFSYSYFKNISFEGCGMFCTNLSNSSFISTFFYDSIMYDVKFDNIQEINDSDFRFSYINDVVIRTLDLNQYITRYKKENIIEINKIKIRKTDSFYSLNLIYNIIKPFFKYYLDSGVIKIKDIPKILNFNNKTIKKIFIKNLIENTKISDDENFIRLIEKEEKENEINYLEATRVQHNI